jgi:hypothetical protein
VEPSVGVGVGDAQSHVATLIDFVGVHAGLTEFVAREGGATPRAVGNYFEILIQQTAVEELLELPPH